MCLWLNQLEYFQMCVKPEVRLCYYHDQVLVYLSLSISVQPSIASLRTELLLQAVISLRAAHPHRLLLLLQLLLHPSLNPLISSSY